MVLVRALNAGRRKRKDGLNFVVCQVTDPGFADTDGKVRQFTLFLSISFTFSSKVPAVMKR